jgi:hypothetical protein
VKLKKNAANSLWTEERFGPDEDGLASLCNSATSQTRKIKSLVIYDHAETDLEKDVVVKSPKGHIYMTRFFGGAACPLKPHMIPGRGMGDSPRATHELREIPE